MFQQLGVVLEDNEYIGAPSADHRIDTGQTLVIYGHPTSVYELDCRCTHEEQAYSKLGA